MSDAEGLDGERKMRPKERGRSKKLRSDGGVKVRTQYTHKLL